MGVTSVVVPVTISSDARWMRFWYMGDSDVRMPISLQRPSTVSRVIPPQDIVGQGGRDHGVVKHGHEVGVGAFDQHPVANENRLIGPVFCGLLVGQNIGGQSGSFQVTPGPADVRDSDGLDTGFSLAGPIIRVKGRDTHIYGGVRCRNRKGMISGSGSRVTCRYTSASCDSRWFWRIRSRAMGIRSENPCGKAPDVRRRDSSAGYAHPAGTARRDSAGSLHTGCR